MLGGRILGGAAFAVSLLSVGGASAATLSLSGSGTPGVLTSNFNPSGLAAINADGIGVGTAITVFSGNTGGLFLSSNTDLTFTFMGKEASYTNQLLFGNTVLFDNNGAPGAASVTVNANAGLVPFSFQAVTPGNLSANNGGTFVPGLQIAFVQVSELVYYALFDDGGGRMDRDFDDMVVRITDPDPAPVAAVPLPAALPLFATGLGALGLLGWRRKRKAVG